MIKQLLDFREKRKDREAKMCINDIDHKLERLDMTERILYIRALVEAEDLQRRFYPEGHPMTAEELLTKLKNTP